VDKLGSALEKVKSQMADPDTAKIEESTTEESTVATKTKKAPKKKAAKTNGAAKKVDKAEDGLVSLKALAAELKIEPRLARVKLRKAEIENPGRWAWKDGSAELTKIRKLLSAE
jgi:hypothetical protein